MAAPTSIDLGAPLMGAAIGAAQAAVGISAAGTSLQVLNGDIQVVAANTSNFYGLVLGPYTSAGIRLFLNTGGILQAVLADGSANANISGATFPAASDPGAAQFTLAGHTNYGLRVTANNQAFVYGFSPNVQVKAASYTVTTGDSGTVFQNSSAGAQVVYTLPAGIVGLTYTFVNTAAGATFTQIKAPATDKLAYDGTQGALNGTITSAKIWTSATVTCFAAGLWVVTAVGGVNTGWTLP